MGQDNFKQVNEAAMAAFNQMQQLGIPPIPNNYTLWFGYFSGSHPDLKKTIDILLANRQKFTPERNAELFNKFFTLEEETSQVHATTERLEAEISRIMSFVRDAGGSAEEYGKTLADQSRQINEASGTGDIQAVIGNILSATKAMEERNRALETRLAASSQEVAILRDDLEKVRHESLTDALTGIPNRKVFDASLRSAAAEASEAGEDLCLLMVDIDYFKRFNDSYGHLIGDQVLKILAQVLTSAIKGQDTAARYGGEEFGVILPKTPIEAARSVAENIRQRLGSKALVNRKTGEKLGKLSVSIGIGLYEYGEPLTNLIARADACLYAAKQRGRDRVIAQSELTPKEISAALG